jgi:TolB-like protein/Tfp pilus assembly protein PilF
VRIQRFFAELKRRNVYRVAITYGVVAWLIIQIATQVLPFFEVPNWGIRLIVLFILFGFPFALIFAWAFELTPEGIKRTADIPLPESVTRSTGRKLELTIIGVLVAIIGVLVVQHSRSKETPPDIPKKSIAVLPFENRSSDKENAYFADGVQDEILARLSEVSDLKVISLTSTQHYKSAPENLPEIAKQLGVAHILEGSVQKNGDAVRVNVQLIKAVSDSHVWAQTFDRKLNDIFSVESDIAEAVADQLRVQLSDREKQVIAAKPTDNSQAYDAYLRGLAFTRKAATTPANALSAQTYLREAVRLDPKFALSWALLSYVDSLSYLSLALQPTDALREEAKLAAETALTLQPALGEALQAKGFYYYACLRDYDQAIHYLEQARLSSPNDSGILASLAYIARRQGLWQKSESYFNEAERLDPRNVTLLTQHAFSFIFRRQFPESLAKLEQVLDIVPDDFDTLALKAAIAQASGDLTIASALLSPLQPGPGHVPALEAQIYQAILERHPDQIIPRLRGFLEKPDPNLDLVNGQLRFWLGWAQEVAGDHTGARDSLEQAKKELEPYLKEQPRNTSVLEDLALIHAGLGDNATALQLARKASDLLPPEKDAVDGLSSLEVIARIAARAGDHAQAISALRRLLSVPYEGALGAGIPLTPALLRLDPMFDSLQDDPAFIQLTSTPITR